MSSFTIITTVKNGFPHIKDAVASVNSQTGASYEHLVLDGQSTDGTLEFLHSQNNIKVYSEKDNGIYDGLNKGLKIASNDVIGILHADDFYADTHVLADIGKLFDSGADIVYADLDYVKRTNPQVILRKWRARLFQKQDIEFGWMPPHSTFFFRRSLIQELGHFDLTYDIASDYDFMLRYVRNTYLTIKYLPRTIIKMRIGGKSNKNFSHIMRKSYQDYLIAKKYFRSPLGTVICKNLRKIHQIQFKNLGELK